MNLLKSMAMAAALMAVSAAHADDNGAPLRFLVGGGVTYGGDALLSVQSRDYDNKDLKAGGLGEVYGGFEYRLSDKFSFQNTIGYHVNYTKADGGKIRFTRIPIDLLAVYAIAPNMRIGAGAQLVAKPELKGTGWASGAGQKYDNAVGLVVEGEYLFTPHMGLKLRYVKEEFKPDNGGAKVDGSHAGVLFSYYF